MILFLMEIDLCTVTCLWEGFVTKLSPYSLGLYQWSSKVVHKAVRLWDIRGGRMLRHAVHLLVTPRVVVSARYLSSFVCQGCQDILES